MVEHASGSTASVIMESMSQLGVQVRKERRAELQEQKRKEKAAREENQKEKEARSYSTLMQVWAGRPQSQGKPSVYVERTFTL